MEGLHDQWVPHAVHEDSGVLGDLGQRSYFRARKCENIYLGSWAPPLQYLNRLSFELLQACEVPQRCLVFTSRLWMTFFYVCESRWTLLTGWISGASVRILDLNFEHKNVAPNKSDSETRAVQLTEQGAPCSVVVAFLVTISTAESRS